MILGIALVVREFQKGPRLIYSYPDEDFLFTTTDLLFADDYDTLFRETTLREIYQQFFSLQDENFVKLFRNPPIDKVFEIAIGDLELISYSSTCPSREKKEENTHEISTFTVVIIQTSKAIVPFLSRSQILTLDRYPTNPLLLAHSLRGATPSSIQKSSLKRVIETIAISLLSEEKRDRYLTVEVSNILSLDETGKLVILSTRDSGERRISKTSLLLVYDLILLYPLLSDG